MLFYFHIKVQHSLIGSTVTKGFSNNPQYGLVVVVRFDSTMLQIQKNMLMSEIGRLVNGQWSCYSLKSIHLHASLLATGRVADPNLTCSEPAQAAVI